jgi:hypothetical protein
MRDDELTSRLSETLRAKAAQLPEASGAVDVTEALMQPVRELQRRPAWRSAVVAAAVLMLAIGMAAAVAVAANSDDRGTVATPDTSVATTALDSTTTSSTSAPTTTTPTTSAPTTTSPITTPVLEPEWDALPAHSSAGVIAIDAYNAYLDAHPERAMDQMAVALKFVAPAFGPAGHLETSALSNNAIAVVHSGLPDDSISAERWELVLETRPDGSWRLTSARWSQQCQSGRGHQDFTVELCV